MIEAALFGASLLSFFPGPSMSALRFSSFFPVKVIDDASVSLKEVADKFDRPEEVALHSVEVANGFEEWERDFVSRFMGRRGSVLDVGCGAGREAIALAGLGFEVTGIDPAGRMIEAARKNADGQGARVHFEIKSAVAIDHPPASFDYVLFSRAVYSFIPTRALRVSVLRSVGRVLKPGGTAVFSVYYYGRRCRCSRTYPLDLLRRGLRFFLKGRFPTEPGDTLFRKVSAASNTGSLCYGHFFSSPEEVAGEIREAGLRVIEEIPGGFWVVRL